MNDPTWRKSGRSDSGTQVNCVEAARLPGVIGVRDSKNPQDGHLAVTSEGFAQLLTAVKAGEYDL